MIASASTFAPVETDGATALVIGRTRSWYDRNAETYSTWSDNHSMESHLRRFLGALPAWPRILDLGAGGGRDLAAFAMAGARAVGIDNVPALTQLAHQRSGCPVIVADMRNLPFPDLSFDGVWASASLLHLPRAAVHTALAEVRRVLNDEGRFFSSVKLGTGEEADANGRWFSYYGRDEWCEYLEKAGFSPILIDEEMSAAARVHPTSWLNILAKG